MKKNNMSINIVFNFIAQLITYITPLVVSPYISRVLLPEGIGRYSYAASITYYFAIIVSFGFLSYGTTQIAASRQNKVEYSKKFWNILFVRSFMFIISLISYIMLKVFFNIPSNVELALYMVLILSLIGEALDIAFLFQGLEKFKILSISNVFVNLIYLLSILFFVKDIGDLLTYTAFKSSIKLVLSIILWFIVIKNKYVERPYKVYKNSLNTLYESFIFFLPSLVMTITPQLDQTMLGSLSSDIDCAYYQQTHKLVVLISAITYSIGPIMLSRLTNLYKNNNETSIMDDSAKLFRITTFIMFPCVCGLYSIARYFIPAYYGDPFAPTVNVLYLFLPVVIFSSFSSLLINGYYYPSNNVVKATLILFCTVLFNFITNIFAIKNFGAKGAALTSSFSEFIALILLLLFTGKFKIYIKIILSCWKTFLSGLFMLITVLISILLFDKVGLNSNLIISILGILIGFMSYCLFNILLKDTILYTTIKVIFNKKGSLKP